MDEHEKKQEGHSDPLTREQEIGRASLYALRFERSRRATPEEIKKAVSARYLRANQFLDEVYE